MTEFTECLAMLDSLIANSEFSMFTGAMMNPKDYRILKAWVVAVEERLKALEVDYDRRQGDGR